MTKVKVTFEQEGTEAVAVISFTLTDDSTMECSLRFEPEIDSKASGEEVLYAQLAMDFLQSLQK